MLGSRERRLLELVDALRVARPERQHTGEAGADHDLHPGCWRSGEHLAGHRLGVSRPAARQQRLDQLGGERIADRVGGIGDLQRSLQQPDRRRRRPRRRELRRPSQPPHRLGVAVLGPEGDVTRQPLDGYAGAAQHSTRLTVQALAHRCGEILVDGIAHEVVAERETITRFGEQPGIHRRGQRRNQLRRSTAGEQPQLGQRERRAQDRSDPQQVQGLLGEQAQPAQQCQAQGGWQRRRAGLGPPVQHARSPPRRRVPVRARSRTAGSPRHRPPARAVEGRPGDRPPRRRGEPPPPSSTAQGAHARRPAPGGRREPGRRPRHGIHRAPSRTTPTAHESGDGRWSAAHAGSTDRPIAGPPRRERPGPWRRTPPRHPRRPPRSTTPRRRRPRRARRVRARRPRATRRASAARGGSGAPRSSSSASRKARSGRSCSTSSHAPCKTRKPRRLANASVSAIRRDLPIPASPSSSAIRPRPLAASSTTARRTSSSTARPTNRTPEPTPTTPIPRPAWTPQPADNNRGSVLDLTDDPTRRTTKSGRPPRPPHHRPGSQAKNRRGRDRGFPLARGNDVERRSRSPTAGSRPRRRTRRRYAAPRRKSA